MKTNERNVNPESRMKAIDIILTCVISFLVLSMIMYLFSLRPWNHGNTEVSASSGKAVLDVDNRVEASTLPAKAVPIADNTAELSDSSVEAALLVNIQMDSSGPAPETVLTSVETRLVDLGNYVTFIPFGVVSDSDNNPRSVLGNFVTVRPVSSEGDPKEVYQRYKEAADRGDAAAQYVVYAFEYAGIGCAPSDPNEMMTYLCASAENGYAPAQNELGLSYAANKNFDDAAIWLEKAADRGYPAAQNNLGILYHNGYGVPIDFRKACDCFLAAAEQGIPEAQFNLGFLYENGFGIEQDSQRAFEHYLQAAKAGYCLAQTFVGDAYRNGAGTVADPQAAFYWYSLAAEQGDFGAAFWLGTMYESGIGVEQNAEYAGMWYSRAVDASRDLKQSLSE